MGIYYHYNEWGHLVFIHGELFENSYYHYLTCKSTTYIHNELWKQRKQQTLNTMYTIVSSFNILAPASNFLKFMAFQVGNFWMIWHCKINIITSKPIKVVQLSS